MCHYMVNTYNTYYSTTKHWFQYLQIAHSIRKGIVFACVVYLVVYFCKYVTPPGQITTVTCWEKPEAVCILSTQQRSVLHEDNLLWWIDATMPMYSVTHCFKAMLSHEPQSKVKQFDAVLSVSIENTALYFSCNWCAGEANVFVLVLDCSELIPSPE